MQQVIVQKFGGTSVASIPKLKKIAENISKENNPNTSILVVLSAMGKSTDKSVEMNPSEEKQSDNANPTDQLNMMNVRKNPFIFLHRIT